ncbi:MAG TPA: uracil-DNA glycosylase [Bdellovibrionales bacterium]|nr:uracil-DNA glycosylase [Bdellovibrionales bacterium]
MTKSRGDSMSKLDRDIVACTRCPRLIRHCQKIAKEKKRAHQDEKYWGKPITNFGDPKAKFLIVGLAPAAHGANRTGRMFTGDRSGQWLYRALHRAGFANQSSFEYADDGLKLRNCLITATAHCAPPDNKPTPKEIGNCEEFLTRTFQITQPRVILALGSIAWTATFLELKKQGQWSKAKPAFGHGAEVALDNGTIVIGSYHPSQQNTFTGRLTEPMFDSIFSRANALLSS